jgi:hypothetical protein
MLKVLNLLMGVFGNAKQLNFKIDSDGDGKSSVEIIVNLAEGLDEIISKMEEK